jgi:hypothetical protein
MWISRTASFCAAVLAFTSAAVAEAPLSAIDWLSQSVATPAAMPVVPRTDEPAVTHGALPEDISVQSIDGPSIDAVGLLPVSVTGLPRDLWGPTPTADLVALIRAQPSDAMPALKQLLQTLLLAELDPPVDSDGRGLLFLARIDRLLDMGALDPAMALLDQAGTTSPETFRRWFDVALLTGAEDRTCTTLANRPDVAPTIPATIFCLAQNGDWAAAATTLHSAEALGEIDAEEVALLSRFLDPELYEGEPPLPVPERLSPLKWRMMEAIGQPLATNALPVAFAHGDLRSNTGWKGQIEAAERLTRSGALAPNRLLGLYDASKPAASGGVWDRAAAMQAFDRDLAAGDANALTLSLPRVWSQMVDAELEVAFADLFGEALAKLPLQGTTAALAFRIGLLSPAYEAVTLGHDSATVEESFWAAIARGDLSAAAPVDQLGTAIRDGFTRTPPPELAALVAEDRIGEVILKAALLISKGALGEVADISAGLSGLRAVGLEEAARRTALELVLLERRG